METSCGRYIFIFCVSVSVSKEVISVVNIRWKHRTKQPIKLYLMKDRETAETSTTLNIYSHSRHKCQCCDNKQRNTCHSVKSIFSQLN